MEHKPTGARSWETASAEHFTGRVWFDALSHDPAGLNALGVMFEPGARTDWHSHPAGQVLYVTAGTGKVQNELGETAVVGPGDVVHAPAGERHWHGSTPTTFMMHLSLTTGGDTQWSADKVSDEDYLR